MLQYTDSYQQGPTAFYHGLALEGEIDEVHSSPSMFPLVS